MKLVGADGKPIVKKEIPVVKWRDYQFPIRTLGKEDILHIVPGVSITPEHLIKEYRKAYTELSDRVNLLTAMLGVLMEQGPEAAKEFASSIGMECKDYDDKQVFPSL